MSKKEKQTCAAKQREIIELTQEEHMLLKSMWTGASKEMTKIPAYIYDAAANKFTQEQVFSSAVMIKLADEIIVNALDQYAYYPDLVKQIDISMQDDGFIVVRNDGPGIPVVKRKTLKGDELYLPEYIFTQAYVGSNLDDKKNTRIGGGTNGLGAKITVIFSEEFFIETVDQEHGLKFTQRIADNKKIVDKPIIEPDAGASYTQIKFKQDFKQFSTTCAKALPGLKKLICARAWQANAYCDARITFNGVQLPKLSFSDYCAMYLNEDNCEKSDDAGNSPDEKAAHASFQMRNAAQPEYPWDICVALSNGSAQQVSIVNGLVIEKTSSHTKFIQEYLATLLEPIIKKNLKQIINVANYKFNKTQLFNNLFIFMRGIIPNTITDGQGKGAITNAIENFTGYLADRESRVAGAIWDVIKTRIISQYIGRQQGDAKQKVQRSRIIGQKYREAKNCQYPTKRHACSLIIAEGDSAITMVDNALKNKNLQKINETFNYDYYGTYSIQGVAVNGLKASSVMLGDTEKHIPSEKIKNNKRIKLLYRVLGLEYKRTYDFSAEGENEWKTLRYGSVCILVDQDLDGFNIFGLIATYFMTYWPSLVKRGFIRRIVTPLIRIYPKSTAKQTEKQTAAPTEKRAARAKPNTVYSFYNENDALTWISAQNLGVNFTRKYEVEYYKGLARHDENKKEITEIFTNIDAKIKSYNLDEDAVKNMRIYYGKETLLRKVALSTPVSVLPTKNSNNIPLSEGFQIDTKLYQRDNIIRKLLNVIDGLVISRRKVLYTTKRFTSSKEERVSTWASRVTEHAAYHHGEASIQQTITKMAQGYARARNFPLLIPCGVFGSYQFGYKDAGQPRYICTKINKPLVQCLFRPEDDFILDYELVEGKRYEPVHYAPILPYTLMESNSIPGTGWKIEIYARRFENIVQNVLARIDGKIARCGPLPLSMKDFKGSIVRVDGKKYSVGCYKWDDENERVTITELPLGMFSDSYLTGSTKNAKESAGAVKRVKTTKPAAVKNATVKNAVKKSDDQGNILNRKPLVKQYDDETSGASVRIELELKPGASKEIEKNYGNANFDCMIEYLGLKKRINDLINLVNERGEVVEYATYEDAFETWFVYRKALYAVRVERELIINDLEVRMLKNMQRFSEEHERYKINKKTTDEAACAILASHKYQLFNKSLVQEPKHVDIQNIAAHATSAEHGASYDYLLNLSYRNLTTEAFDKREEEIRKLLARREFLLDDTGAFKGANLWKNEIVELLRVIKEGQTSDWLYGDKKEYNFTAPAGL